MALPVLLLTGTWGSQNPVYYLVQFLTCRRLYWGDVHQENAPVFLFSNQNNTHPMNPNSFLAGEDRVFPENTCNKEVARIRERILDESSSVFLGIWSEQRLKTLENLLTIPALPKNINELCLLTKKLNQFLWLMPLQPGKETIKLKFRLFVSWSFDVDTTR